VLARPALFAYPHTAYVNDILVSNNLPTSPPLHSHCVLLYLRCTYLVAILNSTERVQELPMYPPASRCHLAIPTSRLTLSNALFHLVFACQQTSLTIPHNTAQSYLLRLTVLVACLSE
jgi:hypothetical protein